MWIQYELHSGTKPIPEWKSWRHHRNGPLAGCIMYFADICEPGWTYFKGFCYLTSKTCQNWTTARDKCRQENAFLVDVQNNEENVFLQHLHNGKKSWLGFNDIFTEGSFTWIDDGTGNFTAWAKNQPNNFRDEDCVHALGVEYKYKWNDVKCSDCHQYTCKKGRIWKIKQMVHFVMCGWLGEWINELNDLMIFTLPIKHVVYLENFA